MNVQTESRTQDLFYESLIQSHVDGSRFVDRPWLAEQVKEALGERDRRFVLLTGEPGCGKTAVMAYLASEPLDWQRRCLWLRYFIRRDSQTPLSSGDARSFLFAVGHQLASLRPDLFYPDNLEVVVRQDMEQIRESGRAVGIQIGDLQVSPFYKTALKVEQQVEIVAGDLVGISVQRVRVEPRFQDLSNLQYLALIGPARALQRQGDDLQIVVLVDALDELRYFSGGESILYWLTTCPELPDNVRLVLTSRPDEALLCEFRGRQEPWLVELFIDAASDKVGEDVRSYAERFVVQEPVQQALLQQQVDPHEFVDRAVSRAEGNFQYLAALFRSLEQVLERGSEEEIRRALALEGVPAGLQALYAFFMRQVRNSVAQQQIEVRGDDALSWVAQPAWERLYQLLLGTLSVARQPLDHELLRALSRVQTEARWIPGAVDRLSQFLDPEDGRFRLYRATLLEFLTAEGTWTRYPDCYLGSHEWHCKIVGHYLSAYAQDWSECDDYGLTHLIQHVIAAELPDQDRAAALDQVLNEDFEDACMERFGWLYSYVEALEALAGVEPQRAATACLDVLLERMPNSLVMQRALRLLVKIRPATGQIGNPRSPRHRAIDEAVEILSRKEREEALNIPCEERADAAADLTELLNRVKNLRVKGIVALALGETGSREATPELMEMLETARRQGSWAAADALLALDDRSIVPKLVQWYDQTKSLADKERILYILGWMHAEEARELQPHALASGRAKNVGRAVDLVWLLSPAEGDVAYLLERLKHILESDPERPQKLGPWKDEWLQKRLVRALHKLGIRQALPALKALQAHLDRRGEPRDETKRAQLESSIRKAIRALAAG